MEPAEFSQYQNVVHISGVTREQKRTLRLLLLVPVRKGKVLATPEDIAPPRLGVTWDVHV